MPETFVESKYEPLRSGLIIQSKTWELLEDPSEVVGRLEATRMNCDLARLLTVMFWRF